MKLPLTGGCYLLASSRPKRRRLHPEIACLRLAMQCHRHARNREFVGRRKLFAGGSPLVRAVSRVCLEARVKPNGLEFFRRSSCYPFLDRRRCLPMSHRKRSTCKGSYQPLFS
jgi:hypothetical protein